ncbi:MAG: cbb3-type cytochrome oxidase assembly protein CcoS [Aliihoeflea sp.]|jgi:cbb3-type cytochrome oxidase maturation protein
MSNLIFLIPIALFLGGLGLAAFIWSLSNGQYEDLDGAAERILIDEEDREQPMKRARREDRL